MAPKDHGEIKGAKLEQSEIDKKKYLFMSIDAMYCVLMWLQYTVHVASINRLILQTSELNILSLYNLLHAHVFIMVTGTHEYGSILWLCEAYSSTISLSVEIHLTRQIGWIHTTILHY
ncbi:hypothetical protein ACJX0J_033857, partial [Zea mays]